MSTALTVLQILEAAPARQTAIIVPDLEARVSYEALRAQVHAMADALAAAGVRRDQRIAIALPNGLAAIVSFLAASIAGVAAPMNPSYRADEFRFFFQDTNASALITSREHADEARCAAAECEIPVLTAEVDEAGRVRLVDGTHKGWATSPKPDDIALVLHTSGSTGRPKRVPLRHRNLVRSAANIARHYELSPDDVSLCLMPLFHVHGIVASTLAPLVSGGTVVAPIRFNPLALARLIREHRVSWYTAVPTIHQIVLARAHGAKRMTGIESLRFIRSASAPLPPSAMHQLESLFGVPVLEAYGMTEAAHQMASNPLPPAERKAGSVGLPTGVEISIMDDAGLHLGGGQRGEVVIKGPNVFSGYENDPEANASAFTDGWFRTGDEGWIDPGGYVHLSGRIKELINRAGEKVAPRRIDEVLLRHPAVAEAVTFAMAHESLGEEVAAAVVLREPLGETELLKYCREHLAHFESPKKIFVVDAIPRTATGKVQRRVVAAEFAEQGERAA